MIDLAEKYAPGLVDLAHQLVPFQDLISTFTAGPQEFEADKSLDEYIWIQVPDVYFRSNQIYVTITRDTCYVVDKDGVHDEVNYEMTFQGLLDYLSQLPQPLHHFAR